MAVFEYDEHGSAYADPYGRQDGIVNQAQRWVRLGGAVTSLGLVVGLAAWGYELAVRDVTGVPVMRAVAGAMRVIPDDPEGKQTLNQGLTVNALVALGTSAKLPDTITLAPMPVELQPSDVPFAQAEPANPSAPVAQPSGVVASAVEATTPQPAPILTQDSVDAAVAAALEEAGTEQNVSVLNPALRPKPRPADLGGAAVQALVGPDASASEIDPSTLPSGTILAQFGAYDTPDNARAKFSQVQENFPDLMAGKAMVVQPAQSNSGTLYRLRAAGLSTQAEVESFCAALQAEGTECVPLTQR